MNQWNNINQRWGEVGWAGRFRSDEYWDWRGDVYDFRRNRCEEIWDHREDFWDEVFDDHWWGSCWWRPGAAIGYSANISPWWWWRPFSWDSYSSFYGATAAPQQVIYDPGTTVVYEGDTVYVNGTSAGSATQYREQVAQLATPSVSEIPIPEPAAEGQADTWMPLGVWALTQQEQGDANIFFQLSADKNGLVSGAYKNVMTGDEEPVVGQVDREKQRVAWHVGEVTQTVYETGLSSLTSDVASVFVHFGNQRTQTWLMVRLPSPEVPPGPVKLPEFKKP